MQNDILYDIIQLIKCQNGVDDYKVVNIKKQSFELFFVLGKLETVRKAVSDVSLVTLYVDHDDKRGNSTFEAYPSMTKEELEAKLRAAYDSALLVFDEPYTLPEGGKFEGEIESDISRLDEKEVAARVERAVQRANVLEGGNINALEVFVVRTERRIVNSRGLDKKQVAHTISVEAIPTANGESGSVELFDTYTLGELDEKWLEETLRARLYDARERLDAKRPAEKISCPVIFDPYELKTLFGELIDNANYATVYAHANTLSVGEMLQSDPKGDKLNITMRAKVDGSPASALFDGNDGAELHDKQIVKDGKLVGLYGSHRFAQYLGEDATGTLGCIDVASGSMSSKEMLSLPHLELVYLSGLQVDVYNDYIGGEIRLAYYFDGVKRHPVTSIAMSGKLSEALNTAILSKERTVLGEYSGPEKLRLEGLNIY